MIEKRELLNELFDIYGSLLTEKQNNIFMLYYQEDLSLSEISEELGISRNGVYDSLKRAETILLDYEEKLKFLDRIQETKVDLARICDILDDIKDSKDLDQIDLAKGLINAISDSI